MVLKNVVDFFGEEKREDKLEAVLYYTHGFLFLLSVIYKFFGKYTFSTFN